MLNWRTVTPSREPRYWTRGTELSVALVPNCNSRFQICEIRTTRRVDDDAMEYDREFVIRDAATVSDADVRDRVRPHIVQRFSDEGEALAWCDANR